MSESTCPFSYRMSSHAAQRMHERGVTWEELLQVLNHPTIVLQTDAPPLLEYRAYRQGRDVSVIVDALSDTIVTVVSPSLNASGSRYGWLSIGASLEAKR